MGDGGSGINDDGNTNREGPRHSGDLPWDEMNSPYGEGQPF